MVTGDEPLEVVREVYTSAEERDDATEAMLSQGWTVLEVCPQGEERYEVTYTREGDNG